MARIVKKKKATTKCFKHVAKFKYLRTTLTNEHY